MLEKRIKPVVNNNAMYCFFKQVQDKSWNGVNGHTEMYLQYKEGKAQVCFPVCLYYLHFFENTGL